MNPISGLLRTLGALTGVSLSDGPARNGVPGRCRSRSAPFPTSSTRSASARLPPRPPLFRLWKMVPDQMIPGTLNVGHTLPTVAQAFIYTKLIPVDVLTLFSMIAAAVLGSWLGAGVVARWPKRKIQVGMGSALLVAATLMLITQIQAATGSRILPLGGEAHSAFEACCSSWPSWATSSSVR